MRIRNNIPKLVRSSDSTVNSIIVRKFHKRIKKVSLKDDLRIIQQGHLGKPGRTIYIDRSVR